MSGTSLQSILLSKKWFGFDLDDTLHEFRKASGQASQSVFEATQAKFGVDIDTLKTSYQEILRMATANAFTDGRSSTNYRRERFTRLLQTQGLGSTNEFADHLLDVYESSLRHSLTLKPGALSLLQTLQRLEKKVIVVTEGPGDGQRWTIQELGLEPYVNVLITTNEVGRSKVDGLFGTVLEKYAIATEDIVYFGDNEVRDIQAAQRGGILAVLYNEKQDTELENPGALKLNSWQALQDILVQK